MFVSRMKLQKNGLIQTASDYAHSLSLLFFLLSTLQLTFISCQTFNVQSLTTPTCTTPNFLTGDTTNTIYVSCSGNAANGDVIKFTPNGGSFTGSAVSFVNSQYTCPAIYSVQYIAGTVNTLFTACSNYVSTNSPVIQLSGTGLTSSFSNPGYSSCPQQGTPSNNYILQSVTFATANSNGVVFAADRQNPGFVGIFASTDGCEVTPSATISCAPASLWIPSTNDIYAVCSASGSLYRWPVSTGTTYSAGGAVSMGSLTCTTFGWYITGVSSLGYMFAPCQSANQVYWWKMTLSTGTVNSVAALPTTPVCTTPSGLFLDASNNLFVACQGSNYILSYSSSSSYTTVTTVSSSSKTCLSPKSVYVDSNGAVYAACSGSNAVFQYVAAPVQGDPSFTGLMGQKYQVHGIAGSIYNLVEMGIPSKSFKFQFNSLFSFISNGRSLRPISDGNKLFTPNVTARFSHPGTYMTSMSFSIDLSSFSVKLLIESGAWEEGFQLIQVHTCKKNLNKNITEDNCEKETLNSDKNARRKYGDENTKTIIKIKVLSNHEIMLSIPSLLNILIFNSDSFLNVHQFDLSEPVNNNVNEGRDPNESNNEWSKSSTSVDLVSTNKYINGLLGDSVWCSKICPALPIESYVISQDMIINSADPE